MTPKEAVMHWIREQYPIHEDLEYDTLKLREDRFVVCLPNEVRMYGDKPYRLIIEEYANPNLYDTIGKFVGEG